MNSDLKKLLEISELDEDLRKFLFSLTLFKNENYFSQKKSDLNNINETEPKYDDISLMIDFVSHMVINETVKKYIKDKKLLKTIEKKKIGIASFKDQLRKIENREKKDFGKIKIQYSVHRDLSTELSGYTADACWASKELILPKFDNLYSVSIVSNKGEANERLNGSSILLEGRTKNDEKILIIRGLNPNENLINSLDAGEFFDSFVEFLKTNFGQEYKIAVAISDHVGSFTTNRPVLFEHISKLEGKLKKIKVKDGDKLVFNGYDIRNSVYLV